MKKKKKKKNEHEPEVVESLLSVLLDLRNSLHSSDSSRHDVSIILLGSVTSSLELHRRVGRHLLAMTLTVSLGPSDLTRVTFQLEVTVTF